MLWSAKCSIVLFSQWNVVNRLCQRHGNWIYKVVDWVRIGLCDGKRKKGSSSGTHEYSATPTSRSRGTSTG